jgi:hypothetical protein
MTSNVVYLKKKPERKKSTKIDPKKMCDGFLKNKPAGVFAMTWDKDGNVDYYSTHGENRQHFIRSSLMFFLTGFATRDLWEDEQ